VSRRFVILDRDGTINVEVGYVLDGGELELIPGAIEGLRGLRALGLGLVVATNQSPIGRGMLAPERLDAIHDRLRALLREGGVELEGIYVCPHAPEDGCGCRKPEPGLALRAAREHGFDPAEAFVVGDHAADMLMGRRIGATTILVRTGHGEEELMNGAGDHADHVVADLNEAAGVIRSAVATEARR
jgi:D-glycero-D-manno-heptose 1,7-bisphosphate phosphatase